MGKTDRRVYGNIIGLQSTYFDTIRLQPIQVMSGVQSIYDDSIGL
jgi:hypothetical protein